MRSSRVSPIPTRRPVVNGIRASPAASRVARRRSGVLSGARWWGPPGSPSRAARVSSIIPWDGETARRRSSSARERAPALAWGSSPVSARTAPAAATR